MNIVLIGLIVALVRIVTRAWLQLCIVLSASHQPVLFWGGGARYFMYLRAGVKDDAAAANAGSEWYLYLANNDEWFIGSKGAKDAGTPTGYAYSAAVGAAVLPTDAGGWRVLNDPGKWEAQPLQVGLARQRMRTAMAHFGGAHHACGTVQAHAHMVLRTRTTQSVVHALTKCSERLSLAH